MWEKQINDRILNPIKNVFYWGNQNKNHLTQHSYHLIVWPPNKVINVGSDTFGNPIFQKGLQN